MKKLMWLAVLTGCTLLLASCGGTETETSEEPVEEASSVESETPSVEQTEEAEADTDTVSAETILAQSIEAMEAINSYRIDMTMDQATQIQGEEIPMGMELQMDVTQKPMMFHQVISMPNPENGEMMEMEQYMNEDGTVYLHEPTTNQWMSMSAESMGMANLENMQMSPQEQLEMLQDFSQNLKLNEEGEFYKLTVNGSGEELKEIAKTFSPMNNDPQTQADMEQAMNQLDIENLSYVMFIDKETFYQKEFELKMDMAMEQDGQTMSLTQSSKGKFSKLDGIDEIKIPHEAIEQAVDVGAQMEDVGRMEEMEAPM
ncbi:DUF6612 family protein [Bacillus piscicola]|uniref:DUF6612 family protein n=1 Tax=Bacillus piscicola TaxID=1632684 RepID=UPI001F09EE19|nr:DUF6612 family protein [Bacillus piscicola]